MPEKKNPLLSLAAHMQANPTLPIYVQVGYNRFETISYVINDDHFVINIDWDANNPQVETPPTDDNVS
ncbi:hypothetical protein M0R04_07475 [Candidatus Dojkabacteria bacterium]|jgi:hypothetical protein|nr:hypothetical protein [Candidatus Dojkabacteria bacterium]